jgi:hypothetical protein
MKEDTVLRGQIAAQILAFLVTAHPAASDDSLASRAVSLTDTDSSPGGNLRRKGHSKGLASRRSAH